MATLRTVFDAGSGELLLSGRWYAHDVMSVPSLGDAVVVVGLEGLSGLPGGGVGRRTATRRPRPRGTRCWGCGGGGGGQHVVDEGEARGENGVRQEVGCGRDSVAWMR